jgi:tetratricopeptide (TPR) repeat protein
MTPPNDSDRRTSHRERLHSLESLLKRDPANPRLLSDCVDLAKGLEDHDTVLRLTEQALSAGVSDQGILAARVSALIGLRRFRDALPVLQTLLDVAPGDAALLQDMGLSHYCLSEYAQAREPLEAAYRAAGASADLLRLLVSTYHHFGMLDEAVALVERHPTVASALRGERSKAEHLAAIARRLDSTSLSPEIVDALFAGRRGDAKLVRQILQGILAKAGSGTAAGLMKDFHPIQLKH